MNLRTLQHEVVLSLYAGQPTGEPGSVFQVDPRAFRAEAYRAARLGQTVLERLPVFATFLLGQAGGWQYAERFGRSPEFRSVVVRREDLTQSAIAYFAAFPSMDPWGAAVLRLEAALCARLPSASSQGSAPRDTYRLSRRAIVVKGPSGLPAWYAERRQRLEVRGPRSLWQMIVEASTVESRSVLPASSDSAAFLVLRGLDATGGTVEDLDSPLEMLLEFLRAPRSSAEVSVCFSELSPAEASDLLESLVVDGVVERVVGDCH